MAIDTPARIAILGAGPIGLEAALYARYLGYDVDLYESGRVAENLLRWGHVRMFTPFGVNRSPLGLAALKAQDSRWEPPGDDEIITGRQFAERYLVPLSRSDLLADGLHEQTRVVAVGREDLLVDDLAGDESRGDYDFRLLLTSTNRDDHGRQHIATADVVIDATGTFGHHNWLGHGGIPAAGEEAAERHIDYGLPDVLDSDRDRYAGRSILLVGDGYSAATNVIALAELATQVPDTWITWVTRAAADETAAQPIAPVDGDRLGQRARIVRAANALALGDANHVTWQSGSTVDAVTWHADSERFSVRLLGKHAGTLEVDRVVANVGYHASHHLCAQLHVRESGAEAGSPRLLAEALSAHAGPDGLDAGAWRPEMLVQAEPNYYVLGARSYGRNSRFFISAGLEQIRALFALVGDRAELDLYASMAGLT